MKILTYHTEKMSRDFVYIMIFIALSMNLQIYNGKVDAAEIREKVAPAFIVFGDSILDTGNNNYIATVAKANFPPYGRDFPGGNSTGRFSNGKVPSDLFAEKLGVKELLPPYLDPNLQISDLLTGVSFASGGSGYDPTTPKVANVLSLEDQLKYFREYIDKLKAAVGENKTSTIISQSVYLVSAATNDIAITYFTIPFLRIDYNVSTYTSSMVGWASSFVQELYSLGARKIALFGAPPCGCLPVERTLRGGLLSRDCAEDENEASIVFNDKLISELNSLNRKLPESKLVYLDVYNPLLNLITNSSQYGFEVSDKGCCGTGNLETSIFCNKLDITTCKNASKYIFWDSVHPSEAAYRDLVNELYEKSIKNAF